MKQFIVTPAAGKRLIGKGMVKHPLLAPALKSATVVIISGTTNGYVAEEILSSIGSNEKLNRIGFFRGITFPPGYVMPKIKDRYMGDVVIVKGTWQKGKTIYDVVENLKEGDFIIKGATALDLVRKQAAILIGNPTAGTIVPSIQASIGKRVGLIIPVGLEKRVPGDLYALAARINLPYAGGLQAGNEKTIADVTQLPRTGGLRLLPVPGQIFTEIEAIALLTGASTELIGSGGICGAEGACWLAVSGTPEQERKAEKLLKSVGTEPIFNI